MSKKDAAVNIFKLLKRKIKSKIKKLLGDIRRSFWYYHLWPHYYKKYSKKPIDPKKVVFAYSSLYKTMPDNLRCMKEELEKRGYNCVVIDKGEGENRYKNKILNELSKFIDCEFFFKEFGDCKALFLVDYYFPAFANKPREGQHIVQLWHACGAFKMWGYSTADKAWGANKRSLDKFPVHNTYTEVCVSSPKVSFAYAEAFNCSKDVVHPLGTPRTDVYFDPEFVKSGKDKIRELCPGIGDKKIILYAPTFRGNSLRNSYMHNTLDLDALYDALHEEYAFVMKLHPLTAKAFRITEEQQQRFEGFLYNVSKTASIDDALCAADMVISDYSSLIFEYSLLERPMIFYAYDLEKYENDRSFYFDYRSFVPGEIVDSTEGIIAEIKRLETDFDKQKVINFKNDFMSACDGNSVDRIIKAVLGE